VRIALAHKRLDLNGGTERDLYRTAEGLRDLGHEVHLFCSEFGVAPPPGTFSHRVPFLPFGRMARLWSLVLLTPVIIGKHPCDIVVSFGRMLRADLVRCGGGTHRGFLERFGAEAGMGRRFWQGVNLYHRSVLFLEKRQFAPGHYRKIIAVSQGVRGDIVEHYAVPAERITVLYNGVDLERFNPSSRHEWRCRIRREWGIPEQAPLVLFVGSGFRRKGLDRLLSIWGAPELRNAYLLIVGEDTRIAQYRARAHAIAGERIVFAGRQEAVERYFGAADVVALPSIQEAFGNVVLEGLASGTPVVVTCGVGAAEVLRGGLVEGIVKVADDGQELTHKIATQLKLSGVPAYREEARRTGEDYSWRSHFRELEAALMEVRAAKQRDEAS
jgi:UDP-glucose:(heptosyl)LPS alpha-1,3-glucosyltransferase